MTEKTLEPELLSSWLLAPIRAFHWTNPAVNGQAQDPEKFGLLGFAHRCDTEQNTRRARGGSWLTGPGEQPRVKPYVFQ